MDDEPPAYRSVEKRSGRVVARETWVSGELAGYTDWPHLARACRIRRTVIKGANKRMEESYAATSLSSERADTRRLLELSRGHWAIENRLHWVRDVTFDEDRCQVRTGSAPQVLSALRNTAIGLLRMSGASNIAAALRTNAARVAKPLRLVGAITIPG